MNVNFFTGCAESRYNAFFRIVVVILLVGFILDISYGEFSLDYLMENTIGIAVIIAGMIAAYMFFVGSATEGFVAPVSDAPIPKALTGDSTNRQSGGDPSAPVQISSPGHVTTWPAPNNPYMNVLVHEVKYNPTRAGAADVDCPAVKETLENYYRVQWWADPTDVYGKSQDQRMFYTMPSTSIPNDQASFQDWLFKIPYRTCKEGNRDACVPGTNGGAIPWLNQPN